MELVHCGICELGQFWYDVGPALFKLFFFNLSIIYIYMYDMYYSNAWIKYNHKVADNVFSWAFFKKNRIDII